MTRFWLSWVLAFGVVSLIIFAGAIIQDRKEYGEVCKPCTWLAIAFLAAASIGLFFIGFFGILTLGDFT